MMENPEALLKFFSELDPGEVGDDASDVHYASPGVLRRGLEAAERLMAIQEALGVKTAGGGGAEGAGADGAEADPELEDRATEAEAEADRLLIQNLNLLRENKNVKQEKKALEIKVGRLQKQVERLYNKSEMASILGRIDEETERRTAAGPETPEASGEAAADEAVPIKVEAADTPDAAEDESMTLEEAIAPEAAARVIDIAGDNEDSGKNGDTD